MNAQTPFTVHLFVLLAQEAPVGVIFRRGPKDWTQLIQWDTKKDIFTVGQWFRGRLYTERCDISPNGNYLLYFAAKHWRKQERTWTAVSKPPYFTALKIWFQVGTYGGGGVFADNEHVWLHDYPGAGEYKTLGSETDKCTNVEDAKQNAEHMFLYKTAFQVRLARDGWTLASPTIEANQETVVVGTNEQPVIWQKSGATGILRLKDLGYVTNAGFRHHYSVVDEQGREIVLERVKWADFDQQNRLVLAKDGKLFSAAVVDGELIYTELADFNANQPEAIKSPDWAKKW